MGHSEMLLAVAGLKDNEIKERTRKLADGAWSEFPAADRLAFQFAHKITKEPRSIADEDVAQLIKMFGPDLAVDLIWYSSWCNYMTRVADAFQLPLEADNVFAKPAPQKAQEANKPIHILIQTDKGDIEVALDAGAAPHTTANFLKYVEAKLYDGGRFHRTVTPKNQPDNKIKIEVIQAGINPAKEKSEFPPIRLERTRDTGLSHKDGTISMARDEPDTATSDFFICIGEQPALDFGGKRNPDGQGFAAFGRVIHGMEVVRQIQGSPAEGQMLTPPITIRKIVRK